MEPTDGKPYEKPRGSGSPQLDGGSDDLTTDLDSGEEPASRPRAFPDGAVVAERYRILRLIAGGGMGDVYEAEDLELSSHVALKTLREDSTQDPHALELFKQEILLARKVTHPNVCRIFDVGWHRTAEGDAAQPPVMFLTMELLRGETLADRIKRSGRLGQDEVRPLVRQVADALAAAHKAGIIHRDLKSSNIMLVASEEGPRAVVMDFGLARSRTGPAKASQPDVIQGTPGYMGPEQVEGRPTTPATDVYALGVVLYEVLTGRMPFTGDTPLTVALKRLSESPSPPRLHAPELSPEWERVILKCLDKEPSRRFQSPQEVAEALGAGHVVTRHARYGVLWAYGLAAAVVAAAVVAAFLWSAVHGPRAPSLKKVRPSVAVLGFKNASGKTEDAWISTALAEMVTTEIAASDGLRAIPGENVSRARRDLDIGDWDSLARDTLSRLGGNLGADYVVLGSYVVVPQGQGSLIRVDARLQETDTGEIIASFPITGNASGLLEIGTSTGAALLNRLGAAAASGATESPVSTSMPSDPEAARYYAEGIEKLRLLEAVEAERLLERAEKAEPSCAHIHAALATAWAQLGYDARAKEEARKAYDLSASLPREERLDVEARYRVASGDWAKGADVYRTLWGFYPDNLEYGLGLALALTKSGNGNEALETIAQLRALPPALSSDPRIDLAEADAVSALGDWKRQRAAALKAAEKGRARGARQVVAKAYYFESNALRKMGDNAGAVASAEASKREYLAVGDRQGAALAQGTIASVFYSTGDFDKARKLSEENLETFEAIGDQRGRISALNAMANAAYSQGQLGEAAQQYEEALNAVLEVNDKLAATKILSNLANALQLKGDLKEARQRHEEVLLMCRETGDKTTPPFALCGLGEIELAEGNPSRAMERYAEALRLFGERNEKSGQAYATFGIGETLLAQGKLAEAKAKHEDALRAREVLRESSAVAESLCSLARVALEEGQLKEAEEMARRSSGEFRKEEAPDEEALALSTLARILLRLGRPEEALKAAQSAESLIEKSAPENASYKQETGITWAMALGATGSIDDARRRLEAIAAETRTQGRLDRNMEARLALGQLLISGGQKERGLSELVELQREASDRGLALMASKARPPRADSLDP